MIIRRLLRRKERSSQPRVWRGNDRWRSMEKSLNWREFVITRLVKASGYSAILFVALIFFFLVREGIPTFADVKLSDLLSIRWYPIEDHFGILPLITGSLIVTLGAGIVAVPLGIGTAVYISEIAPRWMRE